MLSILLLWLGLGSMLGLDMETFRTITFSYHAFRIVGVSNSELDPTLTRGS